MWRFRLTVVVDDGTHFCFVLFYGCWCLYAMVCLLLDTCGICSYTLYVANKEYSFLNSLTGVEFLCVL